MRGRTRIILCATVIPIIVVLVTGTIVFLTYVATTGTWWDVVRLTVIAGATAHFGASFAYDRAIEHAKEPDQ